MLRCFPNSLSVLVLLIAVSLGGCEAVGSGSDDQSQRNCSIDTDHLREGTQRGSIEALSDPKIVGPESDAVDDLRPNDRVIALLVGDTPLAVPRKLLNQHEIVNLRWADRALAVTYCPLTGSSLVFDRTAAEGVEFDVSGLLLHNNLVMIDRRDGESLWPQMSREATCGPNQGTPLQMVPALDVRWEYWRNQHPGTRVLPVRASGEEGADQTRGSRKMTTKNPTQRNQSVAGPVLGVPSTTRAGGPAKSGSGSIAFPFRRLSTDAGARVVEVSPSRVLFWDQEARTAMIYRSTSQFKVQQGKIVDEPTGSVWSVEGRAVRGPRKGERLDPLATAHVALWSAWSDFHPNTEVWTP